MMEFIKFDFSTNKVTLVPLVHQSLKVWFITKILPIPQSKKIILTNYYTSEIYVYNDQDSNSSTFIKTGDIAISEVAASSSIIIAMEESGMRFFMISAKNLSVIGNSTAFCGSGRAMYSVVHYGLFSNSDYFISLHGNGQTDSDLILFDGNPNNLA